MIVMSVLLSLVLCAAISYYYFHQPDQRFYASNGITAPIELTPLAAANNLSNPLLPPDPIISDQTKPIPE